MATTLSGALRSSVIRKQIIALTGLAMVGFLVAHLAGNLTIYGGPEAFNGYAEKIASLGPLLWVMRIGLIAAFIVHVWLTLTLVRENRAARPQGYEVDAPKGDRQFTTMTMKYTGILVAVFLVFHLYDFTFGTKSGPQSVVPAIEADMSQGLFGLVWNSFRSAGGAVRVPFYLLALTGVGLHLSHAIQSVFQTFGFNHPRYTPVVKMASIAIGAAVAIGFASIPVIVAISDGPMGH
jgi:succinate dehydrogenase / fumarate reductase cytochrome b subunit